jgi:vacuolar protein sorting-associated protein VTA1
MPLTEHEMLIYRRQTADTFLAAATFLELLNIWGEPGTEIHAKIRYAKWNAVRIMKAIKEGKDPNESNPKPEPAPEEELQPLDPNDPEVRQLQGQPSIPHQPSVEEVPDEGDRLQAHIAGRSLLDQSLHPSQQPSPAPPHAPDDISGSLKQPFDPYPRSGFPYNIANSKDDVSPIEPEPEATDEPRNPRAGSIGGGYFPEVPPTIGTTANDHQSSYTSLPTAPPISPNSPPYPSRNLHHQNDENGPARDFDAIPSVPPPADADADRVDYTPGLGASPAPQDFYKSFPSPAPSSPPPHAASHAASAHRPPPPASPFAAPLAPAPASFPLGARARAPAPASVGVSSRAPPPPPEASRAGPPPGGALPTASKAIPTFPSKAYNTDDASVAAASKHARFAISALTFDDVGTAVRELRAALGRLGAE